MDNPLKILIVEDDALIVKGIIYALQTAGYKYKWAPSAEDALNVLETYTPNLIVLDLLLPGMDGYTFLLRIKKNKVWNKMPVIITSNLNKSPKGFTLEEEYIVKSDLDLDELIVKIRKLCN